MADEIDHANDLAQKELDAAIAAARGIQPADAKSADCCIECGEPIPDARRLAIIGVKTCRDCADAYENRLRRRL